MTREEEKFSSVYFKSAQQGHTHTHTPIGSHSFGGYCGCCAPAAAGLGLD